MIPTNTAEIISPIPAARSKHLLPQQSDHSSETQKTTTSAMSTIKGPQIDVTITSDWLVKTDISGTKSYQRISDGSVWYEAQSDDGRKYFYNGTTKESAWVLPSSVQLGPDLQPPPTFPSFPDSGGEFELKTGSNDDLDSWSSEGDVIDREATLSESEEIYADYTSQPISPEGKNAPEKDSPIRTKGSLMKRFVKQHKSGEESPIETMLSKRSNNNNNNNGSSAQDHSTMASLADHGKSTEPAPSAHPVIMGQDPHGTGRFDWKKITKDHISGPVDNVMTCERRAVIARKKYSENGRLVKKRWSNGFIMLSGPQLFFYRDQKSLMPKPDMPNGRPDLTMQVKDITVSRANSNHTSRENTLLVGDSGAPGSYVDYLIGLATPMECTAWEIALKYAQDWDRQKKYSIHRSSTMNQPKRVDSGLVTMLLEKLKMRPSREDLEQRGLIRGRPVFGASLVRLCEEEQCDVPAFVCRAIHAIELRGVSFEFIYRKNVTSSKVQQLRIQVDQGSYNLNSENWEIEALTGALKLFLRELEDEGVITMDAFSQVTFLDDKTLSKSTQIARAKAVLESMPRPHFETCRALFHHWWRVTQEPANNMSANALATVVGPNVVISPLTHAYQSQLAFQNRLTVFLIENSAAVFGENRPAPYPNLTASLS